MKITAVIPVRAGSRRVPHKNILPFGDSNLLIRKIRQLKQVNEIDEIIVSSDSDEMLAMALNEGVSVQKRPIEYCDEKSKTFNEVVEYIASQINGEVMIWAPCVCPFVSAENFDKAIQAYRQHVETGENDSVVSCKLFKEYLFDENGPHNFSIEHHVKSQDLPNWKVIVNGFFIARRADMEQWRFVYGKKPYLISLTKTQAQDIDDMDDFRMCEALNDNRKYVGGGGIIIAWLPDFSSSPRRTAA